MSTTKSFDFDTLLSTITMLFISLWGLAVVTTGITSGFHITQPVVFFGTVLLGLATLIIVTILILIGMLIFWIGSTLFSAYIKVQRALGLHAINNKWLLFNLILTGLLFNLSIINAVAWQFNPLDPTIPVNELTVVIALLIPTYAAIKASIHELKIAAIRRRLASQQQ